MLLDVLFCSFDQDDTKNSLLAKRQKLSDKIWAKLGPTEDNLCAIANSSASLSASVPGFVWGGLGLGL